MFPLREIYVAEFNGLSNTERNLIIIEQKHLWTSKYKEIDPSSKSCHRTYGENNSKQNGGRPTSSSMFSTKDRDKDQSAAQLLETGRSTDVQEKCIVHG